LSNLSNASGIDQVLAAWDQYAKDAPSEIKANVQDIDKYLHDVKDKNYTDMTSMAQKIGVDGQAIGTYYASHFHG